MLKILNPNPTQASVVILNNMIPSTMFTAESKNLNVKITPTKDIIKIPIQIFVLVFILIVLHNSKKIIHTKKCKEKI